MGVFVLVLMAGIVVFLVLRGFRDRRENLGAAGRPMGSGSLEAQTFANPYAKCPACGASGDKMKQHWDGLRKVTWTCGYCGVVAGVQELKDEELPGSARQRLGLDAPQGMMPGQAGYYPPQSSGMGGMGGLLTGMMLGNMLGGSRHDRDRGDDWGGGGSSDSGSGSDWGDGGSSGDGGDSGGGDWGDSGGGDSGGGDF
jgi:ribosomal protein S27AE